MAFVNSSSAQIDFSLETPFLYFPALTDIPFVKHGFSTKLGGVSEGMFAAMNLGSESLPYQDSPANILENYRRMASAIGFDVNTIVVSHQTHTANVREVKEDDRGKGLFCPRDYSDIDGLITNRANLTLVTKYADCVPLFFADPVKKAIGLSHAGWRGTVARIGKVTVEALHNAYGCDPEDIIAVIGPSICADCYEIGREVAEEFLRAFPGGVSDGEGTDDRADYIAAGEDNAFRDMDEHILIPRDNGKYLCDLWAANRKVLREAGLKGSNIHTSGICTSCNSELLFSHRRTGGKRGSLAAFLSIAE